MSKPPKPPMRKKSLDWLKSHYDETIILSQRHQISWAEAARRIYHEGLKVFRRKKA